METNLCCHTLSCKMGFAVKGILRQLRQRFEEEGLKLTLEQYFILNILNNNEGLILQELAEIVERDKSAVLRLINGLEENHFVARNTDPDDKRRKILLVTKNGMQELEKAIALDKEVNDTVTENIPQEKLENIEQTVSEIYRSTIQ
ncbi:MAG: MarR family transcriptional regulator [Fodinibius sp.]|nr:MarR family transcriptional regulator [Fodinibius sp.]